MALEINFRGQILLLNGKVNFWPWKHVIFRTTSIVYFSCSSSILYVVIVTSDISISIYWYCVIWEALNFCTAHAVLKKNLHSFSAHTCRTRWPIPKTFYKNMSNITPLFVLGDSFDWTICFMLQHCSISLSVCICCCFFIMRILSYIFFTARLPIFLSHTLVQSWTLRCVLYVICLLDA